MKTIKSALVVVLCLGLMWAFSNTLAEHFSAWQINYCKEYVT